MTDDDVINYLCNLNPLQLIEITKELEQKWGVKALPQVFFDVPKLDLKKEELPSEVNVILLSVAADKKISVIKILREVANLGLKEAKELAESAPKVIRENIFREEAELIASRLIDAGATVEIK